MSPWHSLGARGFRILRLPRISTSKIFVSHVLFWLSSRPRLRFFPSYTIVIIMEHAHPFPSLLHLFASLCYAIYAFVSLVSQYSFPFVSTPPRIFTDLNQKHAHLFASCRCSHSSACISRLPLSNSFHLSHYQPPIPTPVNHPHSPSLIIRIVLLHLISSTWFRIYVLYVLYCNIYGRG